MSSSATEQALAEAGESLEKAMCDLRDGQTSREEEALAKASPVVPEDSDDLAAAFFAQQAVAKSKETKLDLEAWAVVITNAQQKNDQPEEVPPDILERRIALKNAVVDTLLKEYRKAREEASTCKSDA